MKENNLRGIDLPADSELRDSYVAIVDLLGTSNAMINFTSEQLQHLTGAIREASRGLSGRGNRLFETQYVWFTDNVAAVAAIQSPRLAADRLGRLLRNLADLQLSFACSKYFTRGAIARGPAAFEPDESHTFAIGLPFVDAHRLEANIVQMPCVALHASVTSDLTGVAVQKVLSRLLIDEQRDMIFLDYLSTHLSMATRDAPDKFEAHGHAIADLLVNQRESKVREKLGWLQSYHNWVATNVELGIDGQSGLLVGRGGASSFRRPTTRDLGQAVDVQSI